MKKLTKKQLEKFAKMHLMIHGAAIDGTAFDECGLNEDEEQKCVDAVVDLCKKVGKGLPSNFGSNKGLLEYVRANF